MNNYIEKMLHIKATISEYTDTDKLPLYLRGGYQLYIIKLAEKDCLLAEPTKYINLSALRKQREQLKNLSNMECVLCFESVNTYTKHKLIEEAIPFIIKEKQIYMPFLGIALTDHEDRLFQEINKISYMTQKLLLIAIYKKWKKISLTEVAKVLCVSKMSVTRCFDELEVLKIPLVSKPGRNRYFVWEQSNAAIWNMLRPFLRNPVVKEYRLDKPFDMGEFPLGGISALSSYTMLNDNRYRTYAMIKEQAKSLRIRYQRNIPKGEIPAETIQVLHYIIPFGDGTAVDPLSAILSLTDEDKKDPRIEVAILKVMEETLNDQRN